MTAPKENTEPKYEIVLRAEGAGPPTINRLRRLLKAALRAYGLRCLGFGEIKPEQSEDGAAESRASPTETT